MRSRHLTQHYGPASRSQPAFAPPPHDNTVIRLLQIAAASAFSSAPLGTPQQSRLQTLVPLGWSRPSHRPRSLRLQQHLACLGFLLQLQTRCPLPRPARQPRSRHEHRWRTGAAMQSWQAASAGAQGGWAVALKSAAPATPTAAPAGCPSAAAAPAKQTCSCSPIVTCNAAAM